MSFPEFDLIDWKQFKYLVKAYDTKQKRLNQEQWEIARAIGYWSMITQVKPGTLDISDVKTPYDNENPGQPQEQLTQQELNEKLQKQREMWEKHDKTIADAKTNC